MEKGLIKLHFQDMLAFNVQNDPSENITNFIDLLKTDDSLTEGLTGRDYSPSSCANKVTFVTTQYSQSSDVTTLRIMGPVVVFAEQ